MYMYMLCMLHTAHTAHTAHTPHTPHTPHTAHKAHVTRTGTRVQVCLAVLYLPAAAVGLHVAGSIGLVLANCLNMAARITYAVFYVHRRAAAAGTTVRLLPHPTVLAALGVSFVLTNLASAGLGAPQHVRPLHHACHVALGSACLLAVGAATLTAESELVAAARAARRPSHGAVEVKRD